MELPPECAPYDPEHAMAQNDRHRQRMDVSGEARASADEVVDEVRTALEAVRSSGSLSVSAVESALRDAGLVDPQVNGDSRSVEFGAAGPDGGCVFGEASVELGVSVEVDGYVMDGGCLAAEGH
ncbi:hypothetical protein [Microbacterium sp. 3J1]|uniref:hypothetical protein n=1 Tax=Microbacterium sp. 3J1 TaxID=861269 RepID=UPI000A56BE0A|nr:hypothetical protein [Microbacterium sp. 3J1]